MTGSRYLWKGLLTVGLQALCCTERVRVSDEAVTCSHNKMNAVGSISDLTLCNNTILPKFGLLVFLGFSEFTVSKTSNFLIGQIFKLLELMLVNLTIKLIYLKLPKTL